MEKRQSLPFLPILIAAIAVTFLALLYSFYSISKSSDELIEDSASRYTSYLLADELRQSSDELTRLVRTYTVTGDERYEQHYNGVLDIRGGKTPRPGNYHRIYWDFVAAGLPVPPADGETVALLELMKRAGFTEKELELLNEAQKRSEELIELEVQAFNAVKGLYADGSGNYTVQGTPDRALARNLVHSEDYHRYKGAIMQPINEFLESVETRTEEHVVNAGAALEFYQKLFIGILIALVAEIILLVLLGRRQQYEQLGGTPSQLEQTLNQMAAGNLAQSIPSAPPQSALGQVRLVNEQLKSLIRQIADTSDHLTRSITDVANVVESTASRATQQNEMTDMVATAVHEMGLTVQEIARNAVGAANASQEARAEASKASHIVNDSSQRIEQMASGISDAANSVTELAEQIATIDQVLAVIRGISQQTNLLALNAAIEAARAGEMGRGFAVVADEVRTLAGRTQSSTDEIQQIIQELKQSADTAVASMSKGLSETQAGVESSQQTTSLLTGISEQIEHISSMNQQVATATEEQSSVTEEINRNVQGISDLANTTTQDVQRSLADCQTLRKLADDLSRNVQKFRV